MRRIGDQLVAPGASRGELLVVYAAAGAGTALAVALTAVTVPAEFAWFAPVLLIKLLLGHLLPGEAAPRGAT